MKMKLTILALLTCLAVFALGATKVSPKITWEYKVIYHDYYKADEELNKLGGEGWELVAVEPTSFTDPQFNTLHRGDNFYLKRAK